MAKKKWIVTTSGEQPIGKVKQKLSAEGFEVEQVLGEIGCVIGAATEQVAKKARAIAGVADVSLDQNVDVGPPGSPETW